MEQGGGIPSGQVGWCIYPPGYLLLPYSGCSSSLRVHAVHVRSRSSSSSSMRLAVLNVIPCSSRVFYWVLQKVTWRTKLGISAVLG